MKRDKATRWQRLAAALGWTRSSYVLLSSFLATVFVIGVVWSPLAKEALSYVDWSRPLWSQVDWLLLGDFAAMSLLIMAGADLKADLLIVLVGLAGGLVIESWGTQTGRLQATLGGSRQAKRCPQVNKTTEKRQSWDSQRRKEAAQSLHVNSRVSGCRYLIVEFDEFRQPLEIILVQFLKAIPI